MPRTQLHGRAHWAAGERDWLRADAGIAEAAWPPTPTVGSGGSPRPPTPEGPGRCDAGVGVSNLRVFGSVARGEDRPDRDVDLLADSARAEPVRARPPRGRPRGHPRHPGQPDPRRRPQTGRSSTSRIRPDPAMSDRERQRLADIQAAIDAIRSHLQRGDLSDGLIFDAVRIRLLEIGEAVKALPDDLLATPAIDPVAADRPHARPPRPPLLRHRPRDPASHGR